MQDDTEMLAQSLEELAQDRAFLVFITKSGEARLESFERVIRSRQGPFMEGTSQFLLSTLQVARERYQRIHQLLKESSREKDDVRSRYERLRLLKREISDELRSLQIVTASLLTAGDWQSPSYDHSLFARAGRKVGKINGTYNDYTRDHHSDALEYEGRFIHEYVDGSMRHFISGYAMGSGMAAFATALACIKKKMQATDVILAGKEIYFQNKIVLDEQFPGRVQWVDEMKIEEVVHAVKEYKPIALIFDTLSNNASMVMPDFSRLLKALSEAVTQPTYLLLDNSTRSVAFQPLSYLSVFSPLRLIMIESLNKFDQFGFDRVTGGIVWTSARSAGQIFAERMALGTNITDVSALALVEPNRRLLDQRLARIGRNTNFLAKALQEFLTTHETSAISQAVYPGLESHPSYEWARTESFCGGYFILKFKPAFSKVPSYESFIARVIKLAKKRQIDLLAGSSFGFDTTRIYLTARHTNEYCQPFMRISVGTETRAEIEALKDLLIEAVQG